MIEMVRVYQIEGELNRIIRETKAPIVILDTSSRPIGYDIDTGNILANPIKLAKYLNSFYEVNWKEYLRYSVKHEIIHKDQWEFFLQQGVFKETKQIHYRWLAEIQALNSLPMLPAAVQASKQESIFRVHQKERNV